MCWRNRSLQDQYPDWIFPLFSELGKMLNRASIPARRSPRPSRKHKHKAAMRRLAHVLPAGISATPQVLFVVTSRFPSVERKRSRPRLGISATAEICLRPAPREKTARRCCYFVSVPSTGIEPVSQASEARILSIKLRGHKCVTKTYLHMIFCIRGFTVAERGGKGERKEKARITRALLLLAGTPAFRRTRVIYPLL